MECNRDEAVRAKEIAERKFLDKDIEAAKKFALKAQNLYPGLEGISQLVRTFEIYISAEEKINGEYNWYAVLGATPLADDKTVRKQYRKLALLLHPDKNKSVGAEGAFKLVSQAWSLLSDKSKRLEYDQKYGTTFQERNQTANGYTPPTKQNGFYSYAKNAASQTKVPKGNSSKRDASSGPAPSRKKGRRTFWTVCHRCKMQYEYLRMYLNQHLLCPNCLEAYFATEIEPPSAGFNSSNSSNHSNFQRAPFFESNDAASTAQAANMVQRAYEKVRRERQKKQAATRREEANRRKNHSSKRTNDGRSFGHSNAVKRRKGVEDCGINKDTLKKLNCNVDFKQLLIEKVQSEIRQKLNDWTSISAPKTTSANEASVDNVGKETSCEKENSVTNGTKLEQNELVKANSQIPLNKLNLGADMEPIKQISIHVPDSDFHDFDSDRMARCFRDRQVWAVYDDDDGMPRYYVMIRKVISLNPFEVQISWLNSKANKWFDSGFSKTCGVYGIGKLGIRNFIDSFSHKVKWTKVTDGTIQILPQKGEVWALYRNWSAEWNELTEDVVIHKYDMVKVLEDYNEELGVVVIPLVKVAGYKAIFHQLQSPREIRRIPREEMSRFSHQVPSRLLTGQEGTNAPKGCWELDPAATPLELLQVISVAKETEPLKNEEESTETAM
ncbi:uncharacterized protein LOC111396148 [Olea europaea var. sylvestris]|uniref:J domain-containing protein n=1 Tax=Olea europaea subsp. europaea TaxID=158383 RepID=A0A8S0SN98_OLEEU|nr:uncharacterized protein LOC111396148 [Olea europaea var. sylvestris]CAA2993855.1 Hypothetical predicted protein [Olea europaea subsp. europaea]